MIPACRVVVSGPLEIRVSNGSCYLRLFLVAGASFFSFQCLSDTNFSLPLRLILNVRLWASIAASIA